MVTVIATGFDERIMNAKSTDKPAAKTAGRPAAGAAAADADAPSDDDDPYKEIFKIFNRDR